MRKIDIPFYKASSFYCAQACIKMVLKYFYPDKEFSYVELAKKSAKHKKFGTFSIGLAKALSQYGLEVYFFTSSLKQDKKKLLSIRYYKKYKNFFRKVKRLIKDSIKSGVIVKEKKIGLKEITKFFNRGYIMIPLLNWNVVKGEEGFKGHFVVISGMDAKNIYVHNPGPNHPKPFQRIEKKIFKRAFSSFGTNKDIIIVKGKK